PPTTSYPLSLHDALPICVREELPQVEPVRAPEHQVCEDEDERDRHEDPDGGGGHVDDRVGREEENGLDALPEHGDEGHERDPEEDRKSTRLNSSHDQISY